MTTEETQTPPTAEPTALDLRQQELDQAARAKENAAAELHHLQDIRRQVAAHHDSTVAAVRAVQARALPHFERAEFLPIGKDAQERAKLEYEAAFVREGLQFLDYYTLSDAQRKLLLAKQAEGEALLGAEIARRDAHRARIASKLEDAAGVAGQLQLSGWGPIDEQLTELIDQASNAVQKLKKDIEVHNQQVAALRRAAMENKK